MGWSPIVELRQYTLRPGRRDVLVDLFDSAFVESQERVGMKVIGQFRDLDNPDKFVWLRGFPDMPRRAQNLAEFYGGPVWQANRDEANATMIDSDDVLLLRPARRDSAFTLEPHRPPPSSAARHPRGIVVATIIHLEAAADESEVVSYVEQVVAPDVAASGGSILAYFVSEMSKNTFPSLPVREGEHVFVWFSGWVDRESFEHSSGPDIDSGWAAARSLGLVRPAQVLRLSPTWRSLLHGGSSSCSAAAPAPENAESEANR